MLDRRRGRPGDRRTSEGPLVLRQFFWGSDVALDRLWDWHESLAALPGVRYRLHLLGRYTGAHRHMLTRPYVEPRGSLRRALRARVDQREVWVMRGWWPPVLAVGALVARVKRVPVLLWQERPGFSYRTDGLRVRARAGVRGLLLPLLFWPYRRRTTVLGTGRLAAEALSALAGGAPARTYPYPSPLVDAQLGSPPPPPRSGPPALLHVGTFDHRKGVDVLAAACERLWAQGADLEVHYVGDGALREELLEHARASAGRAHVHPFADRTALAAHYARADVVVVASRFDGWGLVVQEALAAGKPVVVSDACGSADLVADSGCGRVVAAGDPVALADAVLWAVGLGDDERSRLRARALEVAQRLSTPRLNEALLAHAEEALRVHR